MTAWVLLAAAGRHRLLTVVGVLMTAVMAWWAGSSPGVYYQRVNVIFLRPGHRPTSTPTSM